MKEIIFVTTNKGKQISAQKRFDKNKIKIKCYDFEIEEPMVNDIKYIAKIKVLEAYKKVKKPCIALDAGFYINNYPNNPGFPGAFPKRELLEKIGIDGLLKNMQNVEDRTCYFKECLAYYDGINIKYFYGISNGKITDKKSNIDNEKKWSDLWSVFIPNNCYKTLSDMTDYERENREDGHTNALDKFEKWINKKYL